MWTGIGAYTLFENDNIRRLAYVNLIGGIFFIGYYLYHTKNQYLTIENGTIRKKKKYGFGKKIKLNEINRITKKAGYYYLKTELKQLKINVEIIDNDSLVELNKILKDLNLSS